MIDQPCPGDSRHTCAGRRFEDFLAAVSPACARRTSPSSRYSTSAAAGGTTLDAANCPTAARSTRRRTSCLDGSARLWQEGRDQARPDPLARVHVLSQMLDFKNDKCRLRQGLRPLARAARRRRLLLHAQAQKMHFVSSPSLPPPEALRVRSAERGEGHPAPPVKAAPREPREPGPRAGRARSRQSSAQSRPGALYNLFVL